MAMTHDLDSFQRSERDTALQALMQETELPEPSENHNMHMHSFFSFNAEDWSPTHIAWAARKAGLHAAGLCDFDVLDGVEEFLDASRTLGLRAAANIETRVFVDEYRDVDITSPGEPGVTYIMGSGFTAPPAAGSPQAEGLQNLLVRARERNIAVIGRINPHIPDIAIDYESDVLSLVPGEGATERHIIRAYINKSRQVFSDPQNLAGFWAGILNRGEADMAALLQDTPKLEEVVRARLVKSGGLGYEQPSDSTFPRIGTFVDWVLSCDAIPMIAWLDGTSAGEANCRELLECQVAKGCAAINIIPDRNWNLKDPEERAVKVANLKEVVDTADAMNLPVNIGTEMNKLGLPFVDDLKGEVLSAHRDVFLKGANIMVGQTLLKRYANYSYVGGQAVSDYPDAADRNRFFAAVGALPPVSAKEGARLGAMSHAEALDHFRRAAGQTE